MRNQVSITVAIKTWFLRHPCTLHYTTVMCALLYYSENCITSYMSGKNIYDNVKLFANFYFSDRQTHRHMNFNV